MTSAERDDSLDEFDAMVVDNVIDNLVAERDRIQGLIDQLRAAKIVIQKLTEAVSG